MKSVTQVKRLLIAAALAFAGAASAEEAPAPAPAGSAAAPEKAELLSVEDMDALSGGTGVEVVIDTGQVLTATNTGNTVTGEVVGSGQVNIGSGAFAGYEGVGNFVINTGHNNNLQSSMNVTIVLTPGP